MLSLKHLHYLALLAVIAWGSSARASARAITYALLVGSNAGGEGQTELRYAEKDAHDMAEVLTQLGQVPASQVRVLLAPDQPELFSALSELSERLTEHRQRGEEVQFIFYYSGHARATSIQLGSHELPLAQLRQRITALPTTLTLVVLDACQSGAFSVAKGAKPASAFSYNSVERLRTSGIAVMASSSATELSQESPQLRGSYFTRHLLTGLRGAGDRDQDGVVSLLEAYRYAYDRTLSATARTAVGGQHVTLETELTGQGAVPITYPAQAGAKLAFAADLDAEVLVERGSSVVAELHKARGAVLKLALPAGRYTAIVRRDSLIAACAVTLTELLDTQLSTDNCELLSAEAARAKGYTGERPPPGHPTWAIEFTTGLGTSRADAYTDRMRDFGFDTRDVGSGLGFRVQFGLNYQFAQNMSLVFDVRNLDEGDVSRSTRSTGGTLRTEQFSWWAGALTTHARFHVDFTYVFRLYAQAGVGLGMSSSRLNGDNLTQFGPVLSAAAGLQLMASRYFGFVLQGGYTYAGLLHNALDQTHDSGGFVITTGIRVQHWGQR